MTKRLALLFLLIAPSCFAQQWGTLPADALVNMNTSTPGTALTAGIANAGTISSQCTVGTQCTWSGAPGPPQGSAFTVGANQGVFTNLGPVQMTGAGGALFPANSLNFNNIAHNDSNNTNSFFAMSGGTGTSATSTSILFGITIGNPIQGNGNDWDIAGIWLGTGEYYEVQLNSFCNSPGQFGVRIENGHPTTHSPTCIALLPQHSYYMAYSANFTAGTSTLNVYTPQGSLIGSISATTTDVGGTLFYIQIGNNENGSNAGTFTYFQNLMVNWTTAPNPYFWSNTALSANVLAPGRATNWTTAGVTGGIPDAGWPQCVTSACATVTTGPASSITTAQINAAIASAPNNTYVSLPAGTYSAVTAGISFGGRSNVALRGAGANQTFLSPTSGSAGGGGSIGISGSGLTQAGAVSGSTVQGSTAVTLATGGTTLLVGNQLIFDQLDPTCDNGGIFESGTGNGYTCTPVAPGLGGPYNSAGGANGVLGGGCTSASPTNCYHQQQFVTVTSCNGLTTPGTACSGSNVVVGFTPGFQMPNWTAANMRAWWAASPVNSDGIEDLSLNSGGNSGAIGIQMTDCQGCWVKGISSQNTAEAHIQLLHSSNATIENNYFFLTQGSNVISYGVECFSCGNSLVVNNIMHALTTPMITNGPGIGNVFAYNFTINDVYTGSSNFSIPNRGDHASASQVNLTEGNIGDGAIADAVHGTANMETFFRNLYTVQPACWTGGSTYATFTYGVCNSGITEMQINAFHRFFNIVGNVLGTPGTLTNYCNNAANCYGTPTATNNNVLGLGYGAGNDPGVVGTMMLWGNADSATGFASPRFNCAAGGFASPSEVSTFPAYGAATSGITVVQFDYHNSCPANNTLPASFVYPSQPSWWPTGKPWPIIGPDITGGNLLLCSGGTQARALVTSSTATACTSVGGTTATAVNGLAYSNPAMDCYLTLGGLPNGTGPALTNFNESTCYNVPAGTVTITPASSSFGSISQGTLSAWQTFTITNGTASAISPTFTFTGTNSADFLVSTAYNNPSVWTPSTTWTAGQFIVDSNGNLETVTTAGTGGSTTPTWATVLGQVTADGATVKWNMIGAYPNGCGATLAAGASCNIVAAFQPTTTGAENATLNINFTGGPVTASVTGTGSTAFVSPNLPMGGGAPIQVNLPLTTTHTATNPYGATLNLSLLAPVTTYTVCASGCNFTDAQLQTALNQAASDCQTNTSLVQLFNTETINTSTGFTIGNGTVGCAPGKYLRFETNHPELLPTDGIRINHSYAGVMPQIVETNATGYSIQLAHNMSGFEMRGIGFSNSSSFISQSNFTFRCSDEFITATASIPTNVILDQNVFWAGGVTGNLSRNAILADCNNIAVINNDVENYQYTSIDNQAIVSWCSNGPQLISNNTFSATTENVDFGGNGCAITDGGVGGNPFPVPSNVTIASNYVFKPLRWRSTNCGATTGQCGPGFSYTNLVPQPTTAACTTTQCQVNVAFFVNSQRPDIHPFDNAQLINCVPATFNGTYQVLLNPLPTNGANPFTFSVINTNLNSTISPNGTVATGCAIQGFFDPQYLPPADGAFQYDVKNSAEQKEGVNILWIANWFATSWQGSQAEMLIFQEGNPVLGTTNFSAWDQTGNVRVTENTWINADINGFGLDMWTALNAVVSGSGAGSSLGTTGPIEFDNNLVYGLGPEFGYYEEWGSHSGPTTPLANGQLPDLFFNHNTVLQNSVNTALGTFDMFQFAAPNNLQVGQTPFLRDAVDNNILDFGQIQNSVVAYPFVGQKCQINSGLAVPCWTPAAWAANIPLATVTGTTIPFGCTNANNAASFQPNAGPAGVGSTFCPTSGLSAIGLANTTINTASTPIVPGVQTVTPVSMSNISAGNVLFVGSSTNAEYVTVTATTGTTFTANFANAHNSQITTVYGTTPPASSIAHANGTDGLDVGANAAAVVTATSWVPSGIPPGSASGSVTFTPNSLAFGTVPQSTTSAGQASIILNTSGSSITYTSANLSGANPLDFAINAGTPACASFSGGTLGNGASCQIIVTFTPTAAPGTNESATLTLSFTGGGTSPITLLLTGTSGTNAAVTITPVIVLAFPNQVPNTTSAAQNITVTSTGAGNLVLAATNAVTMTGANPANFLITGNTCTNGLSIAPGSHCTITLTFTPTSAGVFNAQINLSDNAPGSPQVELLTGTGAAPAPAPMFAYVIDTTGPCVASPFTTISNIAFTDQTGNFEIQFDATPSVADINGTMGLASATPTSSIWAHLAATLRFNASGFVDAQNGPNTLSSYTAVTKFPYSAGVTYHCTIDVNMAAKTYSAYITTSPSARAVIAQNYAFRVGAPATSLAYLSVYPAANSGIISICNLTVLVPEAT